MSYDNVYVCRFSYEEYNENVTVKTVKHNGGRMMLWGMYESTSGVGFEIKGIMYKLSHLRILQENFYHLQEN